MRSAAWGRSFCPRGSSARRLVASQLQEQSVKRNLNRSLASTLGSSLAFVELEPIDCAQWRTERMNKWERLVSKAVAERLGGNIRLFSLAYQSASIEPALWNNNVRWHCLNQTVLSINQCRAQMSKKSVFLLVEHAVEREFHLKGSMTDLSNCVSDAIASDGFKNWVTADD